MMCMRVDMIITDSKAANRLADDRNVGRFRGLLCQSICSPFVISRSYRGWLSVWQCCRQRVTHLHKTTNGSFAPATYFDFVLQKFRMCSVLPRACASNGLV